MNKKINTLLFFTLLVCGILGFIGLLFISIFHMAFIGEAAFNGVESVTLTVSSILFRIWVFVPLVLTLFFGYHICKVCYSLYTLKDKQQVYYGVFFILFTLSLLSLEIYQFVTTGSFVLILLQEASSLTNFLTAYGGLFAFVSSLLLAGYYLRFLKSR